VQDASGKEVLNFNCLNQHTIRITGRFHVIGASNPLIIDANNGIVTPSGGGIAHLTIVDMEGAGVLNMQ
jgi:hypothetical protein